MTEESKESLAKSDSEVYNLIKEEQQRQIECLTLTASENFTSDSVMTAVGSCLTNKYSEGVIGDRHYGGCEVIDKLELLCQKRALKLFNLDPNLWGVSVQALSGSIANLCVLTGLLAPHSKIMGLNALYGGHPTHGFYMGNNPMSYSSKYFNSLSYTIDPKTGLIDYDNMESLAKLFYPKLIIGGASSYPRDWDYKRMRQICDNINAILMLDISHYAGLIAAKLMNNPFEYGDIITCTTQKSMRGTRGALIFYRKKYEKGIINGVFPLCQGGPFNHCMAGICVGLKECMSDEFVKYSKQIRKNCDILCDELIKLGHKIVTNGSDTHQLIWDIRGCNVSSDKYQLLCDKLGVTLNGIHAYHTAYGGVRIGTPAMTSRGFKEKDFKMVAIFLDKGMKLAIKIQKNAGNDKKEDFKKVLNNNFPGIKELKNEIVEYCKKFPMPGKQL